MAERGAQPHVPWGRRLFLRAVRRLFSPLQPDDYLEMINPLWTTKELRGKVEQVEPQGSEAASVLIRPGYEWPGHKPGQYVRLGVVVDGVYHWRAYSLTSDPTPEDGLVSVTPKRVDGGVVSPYLVQKIQPGDLVRLGEIEGVFTLPEPLPPKLLFISAGSGITPIISMLRSLDHRDELGDVVVIHSARTRDQVMFLSALEDLDHRHERMRLELRLTSERGRLEPSDLDEVCPDWREREAFCSGPGDMLDALIEHWENNGDRDRLHFERFQPKIGGDANAGEGGVVCFLDSDEEVECDGSTSILETGEQAGLNLAYGCRIGICHTCVGTLKSGKLRDLRSGDVIEPTGQDVRICINTAEGDVELEL
ncbi:ferredoxin reductase [Mycobacterium nebraskense]|uniref:Stearoyl-CoA 9-desaturase n=1 Tax=Mycobacterium nebraskense TaxID=244292 RepID=A0A0F5NEY0_9MYCO|nr:ferredoxin reductase [Mycobacterium nebraskense]KKC04838.1 stearoyl-CoA 9-desaturase [Mycobacterium nebraskense]KLO40988.1 stearoyl-CoA 9-desaturase [Mycobacterium nebraskense]MBI2696843.1 ferredoxin reductase [Mycobacterium nebraskense]MCV7118430.1 ferredoxin reductase [Mycobacterium nebraskense]ORW27597.1 stearoyl-CoA 9-desaturase [Mycobacterium nebraskense]